MKHRVLGMLPLLLLLSFSCPVGNVGTAQAKQTTNPIVNSDVIKMVKSGLADGVIVSVIQAEPTNFDVSPNGLVSLQQAGVSEAVQQAMLAVTLKKKDAGVEAVPTSASSSTAGSRSGEPSVTLLQGSSRQSLTLEKTQLAETKSKSPTLAGLARDSATGQAMQDGVNTAAWEGVTHTNSAIGGPAIYSAGDVFNGILSRRKQKVTYIWALTGLNSPNVLSTHRPQFEVRFAGIGGVNTKEFEPVLVKLSPTPNNWRLVGATQGKEGATSVSSFDWPIYSSFIENRVPVRTNESAAGVWKMSVAAPLLPGEYGVVLRPVSKDKKFSGADVASNRGDALAFNSVWSFEVK